MPSMAKKKNQREFETPDYEKLMTIAQVDAELERHKDSLVTKDRAEARVKEEKKDYVKAMNDTLKEISEERDHEMGVIGALEDRKRQLAKIIPMPPQNTSSS